MAYFKVVRVTVEQTAERFKAEIVLTLAVQRLFVALMLSLRHLLLPMLKIPLTQWNKT